MERLNSPGEMAAVASMADSTLYNRVIAFWFATVVFTLFLIWGFRLVSRELQRPLPSGGRSFLSLALSEKTLGASTPNDQAKAGDGLPPSFSRTAGAIGALSIAATFIGIGYYIIFGLFFEENLQKMRDLGWYYLAGAAMFLPYAFNQLSSIFADPQQRDPHVR